MKRMIVAVTFVVLNTASYAHEGHDTPGVLPLPLHGGKLGEATHSGGHNHEGKEKELFFEVVFKGKEVRLFPLILTGKENDSFESLSPKRDLKDITVTAEFPRSKRSESLKLDVGDEQILAAVDPGREYRFFVNVSALHKGEKKTAKIQVERK
ncbi:MAG: hypothetical protein R3B54_07045 [Bdellovibrionota bacterium]